MNKNITVYSLFYHNMDNIQCNLNYDLYYIVYDILHATSKLEMAIVNQMTILVHKDYTRNLVTLCMEAACLIGDINMVRLIHELNYYDPNESISIVNAAKGGHIKLLSLIHI